MKRILFLSLFLPALLEADFAIAEDKALVCAETINSIPACVSDNQCTEEELMGFINGFCNAISNDSAMISRVVSAIKGGDGLVSAETVDRRKVDYCVNDILKKCSGGCLTGSQDVYVNSCNGEIPAIYGESLNNAEKNEVIRLTANLFSKGPSTPSAPAAPSASQQTNVAPSGSACNWEDPTKLCNPLKYSNFQQLLDAIVNFIFTIGMVIAPLLLIIAGFLFVTSAGDANKLKTAKSMMIAAIIGIVVLLVAKGLVKVIVSILQ